MQLSRYDESLVQIDGDETAIDYIKKNSVYSAHAALYSIKLAEKFGKNDIDNMTATCHRIFEDYDGFNTYIHMWYTHNANSV